MPDKRNIDIFEVDNGYTVRVSQPRKKNEDQPSDACCVYPEYVEPLELVAQDSDKVLELVRQWLEGNDQPQMSEVKKEGRESVLTSRLDSQAIPPGSGIHTTGGGVS